MYQDRASLSYSLGPVWNCLKYSGLVHDGLSTTPMVQSRLAYIARCVFSSLVVSLLCVMLVFMVVRMFFSGCNMATMMQIVPHIQAIVPFFVSVYCVFHLLSYRRQILLLFHDWNRVELPETGLPSYRIDKMTKIFYAANYVQNIMILIFIIIWNIQQPDNEIFFSQYPVFRDTLGVPLIAVSSALVLYIAQVFLFIGKAVSVLFFYHAGLAVENLNDDWQLQLQDKRLIGSVWNKYQVILRLVDRANQLFGPIIVVYDFYTFVLICIDAYQLFLCLKYQRAWLLVLVIVFYCFWIGLTTWLMSQVYRSCDKFKRSVTDLLSEKWYQLDQQDRDVLVMFVSRLDEQEMAVCPLNLYTVNQTNVFSAVSLIISYVIVLNQSQTVPQEDAC